MLLHGVVIIIIIIIHAFITRAHSVVVLNQRRWCNDVILTSSSVYLSTVPVNLIYRVRKIMGFSACTCNSWTAASNARLYCAQPAASKQPRDQPCVLRDLGCHAASCLPETNPYCGWSERAAHRCLVWSSTDDFWRGYWPVVIEEDLERVSCVCAKWGHFEYILWTDNVDIVHICYIQCDLFDRCIFNYEIMPVTWANTFLFILQGSALADLALGGRF